MRGWKLRKSKRRCGAFILTREVNVARVPCCVNVADNYLPIPEPDPPILFEKHLTLYILLNILSPSSMAPIPKANLLYIHT